MCSSATPSFRRYVGTVPRPILTNIIHHNGLPTKVRTITPLPGSMQYGGSQSSSFSSTSSSSSQKESQNTKSFVSVVETNSEEKVEQKSPWEDSIWGSQWGTRSHDMAKTASDMIGMIQEVQKDLVHLL